MIIYRPYPIKDIRLNWGGLCYQLSNFPTSILTVAVIKPEDLVTLVWGKVPDGTQVAVGQLQGLHYHGMSEAMGPGFHLGPPQWSW